MGQTNLLAGAKRINGGLIWFPYRDHELCLAGVGRIVEGFARAIAFGSLEVDAVLDAVGKAGEAGFAVDVRALLEIELAGVHESVGDVHFHFRGIDWSARCIVDGQVGGAGADSSIDGGHRMGIDCRLGRRRGLGRSHESESSERERRKHIPEKRLIHGYKVTPEGEGKSEPAAAYS